MRLSQRMARLGHGDRVRGARARAGAGGPGPQRRPPRDRRARLRHPRPHHRGRDRGAQAAGPPTTGPSAGHPRAARGASPRTRRAAAACAPRRRWWWSRPARKPIMFFVILALVDEGDEVLYPNPGFPIYESMIRYIGGMPVPVRLLEEKGFALDVDQLCDRVGPQDAPHHPELPAQPDRAAIIPESGLRAIADAAAQARRARALRRDLRAASSTTGEHTLDRGACPGWSRWPSCSTASPRPTP